MNYILEVYNLVKKYGKFAAVDDISFTLAQGTCFGLLGPNGAGKTTALETIEDIIEPTAGKILYKNEERNASFTAEVGIQFQETTLLLFLTVKETLETFHKMYNHTLPLEAIIRLCHLEEILNQQNDKISGGQKQRLMLALAILNDPQLIFLDEPSTGMDPQNRRNMWEIITSIKKEGKSIILTTHYMEEAAYLCDEIAIMDHGKIIAQGTPRELIQRYARSVTITVPRTSFATTPQCLNMHYFEIENMIEIQTDDTNHCIKELMHHNINLNDITMRSPNLEDVFIHLTGRSLRE